MKGLPESSDIFIQELKNRQDELFKTGEDIERIMELVYKNDMFKHLEDISFAGKYILGLMKIIQTGQNDFEEEYFAKMKKEYGENVEKIRNILSEIMENSSSFVQNIFRDKYLKLSPQCMDNLMDLCEDLSSVKLYLNDLKRN